MSHRRVAGALTCCVLFLLPAVGCATGGPAAEPEPSDGDECAFQLRNETPAVLTVMAGGSGVRQLGQLAPGQTLTFQEECDVDEVSIIARVSDAASAEPTPEPDQGRHRGRMIQMTVAPWPGHVVRVPLRFPEHFDGWSRRGAERPPAEPGIRGGFPPEAPDRPPPPPRP